ncbi:hypothetical protein Q4574_11125 [Aliiglaciecola sp. 3_MG-2023]|uniref:hypothetical protein n=1 Tax=Aliiglaciecola sp. 3_MG-2023 TaxID=3062644 RepID=UPI0026E33CB6|nr:hypothetical protein [Aliiglaciecola sp. 3_MG-2023]MDO6693841.1 hypothetical protein [Aliiglaciecola sp. 3_MG-2023]
MKLLHIPTLLTLVTISASSFSEELKENINYRTKVNLKVSEDAVKYDKDVGEQSKFVVLDNDNNDEYAIEFLDIYQVVEKKPKAEATKDDYKTYSVSDVVEGKVYYLKKEEVQGVPIEKKVEQSFGGLVSGPLIVPFKYRLSDKSISGDATVGYYAGWGWDTSFWGYSERYVTFTPFLSAGLTQVSVSSVDDEGNVTDENKSGFTWATGVLINNWDSVNIGIVYGQDRIGDQNWEHEGEGWLSISVGWEL